MILKINLSNMQQENDTLLMTKTMGNMAEEIKMMMIQPLHLKQKLLNQIFHYSDVYILVTGDIKVTGIAADTNVAFKNFAPFTRCATHTNDEHIEISDNLDIIMPMYNFIEYSDNYADSSGSLYQFRRDESPTNAGNSSNVALDNSTSFKYKASLLRKATDADSDDRLLTNAKIVVPLKYLPNFFRSIEMPLINCKIHLELNYGANTFAGGDNDNNRETKFQITSTKLYIPVVTLSTKDNKNLTIHLMEDLNDQSIRMSINQK